MAKILDFTKTKEGKGVVYGNIGFLKLDELKEYDEVVVFNGHKHLFDGYADIKKVKFIKAAPSKPKKV